MLHLTTIGRAADPQRPLVRLCQTRPDVSGHVQWSLTGECPSAVARDSAANSPDGKENFANEARGQEYADHWPQPPKTHPARPLAPLEGTRGFVGPMG